MIDQSLLWWVLVSMGVALLIAELFIGAFIVMWFGIGAVITGVLTLLVPGMNVGLQILLSTLIGGALMFALRSRYLTLTNAKPEQMHTFSATEGRIHVNSKGSFSVSANGTYWAIENISSLAPEKRTDGATVSIAKFENNKAILVEFGD